MVQRPLNRYGKEPAIMLFDTRMIEYVIAISEEHSLS